jgi:hypothetical protein
MITHNAEAFGRDASLKHAHLLNAWDEGTITVQWEIAILFGLSFLDTIQHEHPTQSGTRLDVVFASWGGSVSFAADIVTVTDEGLRQQSPVDRFESELDRRMVKAGLTTEGFDIRIGSRFEKRARGAKTVLALPPIADLNSMFDESFAVFLAEINDTPSSPHLFVRRSNGIDVEITYTPGKRGTSSRYAGYQWPESLTRNPFYYALDRKAKQLKRAGTGLPVLFSPVTVRRNRFESANRQSLVSILPSKSWGDSFVTTA